MFLFVSIQCICFSFYLNSMYLVGVHVGRRSCRKVLRLVAELSVELTLSLSPLSNMGHLDSEYLQKIFAYEIENKAISNILGWLSSGTQALVSKVDSTGMKWKTCAHILISKCSQLNYDNAACLNKVMSDVTNFLFALLLNKNNSSQREKSEKNNH